MLLDLAPGPTAPWGPWSPTSCGTLEVTTPLQASIGSWGKDGAPTSPVWRACCAHGVRPHVPGTQAPVQRPAFCPLLSITTGLSTAARASSVRLCRLEGRPALLHAGSVASVSSA